MVVDKADVIFHVGLCLVKKMALTWRAGVGAYGSVVVSEISFQSDSNRCLDSRMVVVVVEHPIPQLIVKDSLDAWA